MELSKNIFFNTDRLVQCSKIKISYTGTLFQENAEKVFIHYGFGNTWENLSDVEMTKTDLGFQAEINLIDSDTFNFCFKNNNDEWDNNDCQNYVFNLEHPSLELVSIEDTYSLISPRKLRKSYLINKKIRIAIYKMLIYIPKLITGNYKRKQRNII